MKKAIFIAALVALACGSTTTGGTKGSTDGGAATGGSSGAAGGGGSGGDVCTPGETQPCVGPGACQGGQKCLPDGSAWEECDCGAGGAGGGGGSSGAAGAGAVAGCDPNDPNADACGKCLQANCCDEWLACLQAADCPDETTCIVDCTSTTSNDLATCASQCAIAGTVTPEANDLFGCGNDPNPGCVSECSL